ncbi:MAG TPA: FliM/FliN family flagellar motor switch protein [Armatimonadota bacterium]|nr:FliM/FliN family flagellar motor switch protein [Armatimonadota bacterium]
MDLNDLLADVDGIGGDYYVPSQPADAPGDAPGDAPTAGEPVTAAAPAAPPPADAFTDALEMVRDAEMEMVVELGTAHLPLRDVIALADGGAFTLPTRPEDPVKIFVADQCIGHGEALLIDGRLAIRLLELYQFTA